MCWRAVDVERLIGEDHPGVGGDLGHWSGVLDLARFYDGIDSKRGTGRAAQRSIRRLLISLWVYAYSEGIGVGAGSGAGGASLIRRFSG